MSEDRAKGFLLRVETGSNQAYIFGSNRLRENVGASLLTAEATTTWVDWAIEQAGTGDLMQRSSGSSLCRFAARADAEGVASLLTGRALIEAPGLDLVCGISEVGDDSVASVLEAGRRVAELRGVLAPVAGRFRRLPPAADCASSPHPASTLHRDLAAEGDVARSAAVIAKRRAVATMREEQRGRGEVTSLDELERPGSWIAVVHADGNGIGQQLIDLGERTSGAEYWEALGKLSAKIDEISRLAYEDAAADRRVLKLVVGGDDLTVIVSGSDAIDFAVAYLEAFERRSREALDGQGLSACAGIAIVKHGFPFSSAYALAEALTDNAKRVKLHVRREVEGRGRPARCSALDFHVLRDSADASLDRIRDDVERAGVARHGRPWVTTPLGELAEDGVDSRWAERRHFTHLVALRARLEELLKGGDRGTGRGQVRALLAALELPPAAAEAEIGAVCDRHPAVRSLLEEERAFIPVPDSLHGQDVPTNRLIDAWELQNLSTLQRATSSGVDAA